MARRRFKHDAHGAELSAEPARSEAGLFVGPPSPHVGPDLELAMAAAAPEAVPAPPPEALLLPLEERLRRVEAALTRLAELQEPDPRGESAGGQVMTRPGGPSVLRKAAALLPALSLGARPGGATAGFGGKLGLVRDALAELQAIYYMYVDPRYRLSWFGRFTPLLLLVAFLTSRWWLALVSCGVGAFFDPVVKLVISYAMFKVVSVEARRYRETAPDLPTHLRL